MNRRTFTFLLLLFYALVPLQAQTMRDVLKAAPDSVVSTLTTNNRLDMIDFMDAKMKAEVTNMLGGKSEMLFLSDDSLAIRMSDALLLEMRLAAVDTVKTVSVKQTYLTVTGKAQQTMQTVYQFPSWSRLSSTVLCSTLLQRDDKLKSKAVSL